MAKSSRFSKPKLDQTGFTIEHYAGAVSYRTENFLNKNKDFVVAEHQQLMQNSTVEFVRALFPPEPEDTTPQKVGMVCACYSNYELMPYTHINNFPKFKDASVYKINFTQLSMQS